jgi:hypothetical protein
MSTNLSSIGNWPSQNRSPKGIEYAAFAQEAFSQSYAALEVAQYFRPAKLEVAKMPNRIWDTVEVKSEEANSFKLEAMRLCLAKWAGVVPETTLHNLFEKNKDYAVYALPSLQTGDEEVRKVFIPKCAFNVILDEAAIIKMTDIRLKAMSGWGKGAYSSAKKDFLRAVRGIEVSDEGTVSATLSLPTAPYCIPALDLCEKELGLPPAPTPLGRTEGQLYREPISGLSAPSLQA